MMFDNVMVDSSVVIGYLKGDQYSKRFLEKFILSGRKPVISVISIYAIYDCAPKNSEWESIIDVFTVIPVSLIIAKKASEIKRDSNNPEETQEMIFSAATALVENRALVTHPDNVFKYEMRSSIEDLLVFGVPR